MAYQSDSEEEQFFDTPQDIDSVSDTCSHHSDNSLSTSSISNFWNQIPASVHDRRGRFLEQMGLSVNGNCIEKEEAIDEIIPCSNEIIDTQVECINLDNAAVLRNSSSDYSLLSRGSSLSRSFSTEEDDSSDVSFENMLVSKVRDLNIADGAGKNNILGKLREVGSKRLVKIDKFHQSGKNNVNIWLKKLRTKVITTDSEGEGSSSDGARLRRTRVCIHKKKRLKELSAFYEEQDFRAHEGLIVTMKFSPDGRFLASAGEDGVVRVWKIIEEERDNKIDVQSIDPSFLYFSINKFSKLVCLETGRGKNCKFGSSNKPTKSGCVIFPKKVFRIAEEPLHEFRGHCGEVLSLSWSSNECLLSSSVDKTVRLWQVGVDECIKVFTHNNYVTCVEFNPVDNNYFISGSIDGKIRIWEVSSCRVVDWVDLRDMVTALCYYPDGKRIIVGSIEGSCRFYDTIDLQLQLDTQIFLPGKKKLPCKRITGFQICPSDSSKVLVSSADSQIRVLSGTDVIFKLKGPRMSGNQVTASFTEDGKHIVSGSEDANINVWDHPICDRIPSKVGSCESFVSKNASVAIPWSGIKLNAKSSHLDIPPGHNLLSSVLENVPPRCEKDLFEASSAICISLGRGVSVESWPKGPATWPEEKLVDTYISRKMDNDEYSALKGACENMCSSHMWGLGIVTGGCDGQIKTYRNYGLPVHI